MRSCCWFTFKLLAVGDRGVYRPWLLERLAADAPRILVPGHGDVLVDAGLAGRLAAVARRRL